MKVAFGVVVALGTLLASAAVADDDAYEFYLPKAARVSFHQDRLDYQNPPGSGWSLRALLTRNDGYACVLGDGNGGSPADYTANIDLASVHTYRVAMYTEFHGKVSFEKVKGSLATNPANPLERYASVQSVPNAGTVDTHRVRATIVLTHPDPAFDAKAIGVQVSQKLPPGLQSCSTSVARKLTPLPKSKFKAAR